MGVDSTPDDPEGVEGPDFPDGTCPEMQLPAQAPPWSEEQLSWPGAGLGQLGCLGD